MNPISSWLDPIEVRRLAERLMWQTREPAPIVTDAGFNDAFVGYATEIPVAPVAPVVPVVPAVSVAPVIPAAPEVIPAATSIPFLENIGRFRDWMHRHHAVTSIFLLDQEGSVVFEEGDHDRLHFLARSLALVSRSKGTAARNVRVKIGTGVTLEVIPVDTACGCLVLGAVVGVALPPATIAAAMDELKQVAVPPSFR